MLRPLTPDEFFEFCAAHPDLRAELSPEGRILFMPPCGLDADYANGEIFHRMPLGQRRPASRRSPVSSAAGSLSWWPISSSEVKFPSATLGEAQEKMRSWMANGVIAWLFDLDCETVYVYKPGARVKESPATNVLGPRALGRICAGPRCGVGG